MTTFGDLVQQVKSLLHSYTGVHEQVTWLTSACDADDLTLSVDNAQAVSRGISEIGEELIYVSVSDSGTLALAPFGRGYQGSTAAAHAINEMVTADPMFPIVEIKRAINQTLAATYPHLYQLKETTFSFAGSQSTYELPADCEKVNRVIWEVDGPSGYWSVLTRWSFEPSSEEANGKAINLGEAPEQGATVKVIYHARFTEFSDDADTFEDAGFPESAVDVLLYGAASKLVRFLESARLQTGSVENLSRSQAVLVGDAGKIANQMYAMFQTRLAEERKSLLELHPPQIYFTR